MPKLWDYSQNDKIALITGLWGVHNAISPARNLFLFQVSNNNKSLQIIIIHYFQKINLSVPEKNFQRQQYSITLMVSVSQRVI